MAFDSVPSVAWRKLDLAHQHLVVSVSLMRVCCKGGQKTNMTSRAAVPLDFETPAPPGGCIGLVYLLSSTQKRWVLCCGPRMCVSLSVSLSDYIAAFFDQFLDVCGVILLLALLLFVVGVVCLGCTGAR